MSTLWGGHYSSSSGSTLGSHSSGSNAPNSSSSATGAAAPAPAHVPPGGFINPPSDPRVAALRIVGPPLYKPAASFHPGAGLAPAPTAAGGMALGVERRAFDDEAADAASSILVGLRLGDFGGRVGLLPGLRPKFMDKYAPPGEVTEKKRRAPREDLTGYTAEEKVARRNERARIYTCAARQRQEEAQKDLEKELQDFRLYAVLVEQAPQVGLLVLRADLHAVVLYASKPLEQLLGLRHEAMLGQPLWSHLHPADHARLAGAMGDLILTLAPPKEAIRCRFRRVPGGAAAAPKRKKVAVGGFGAAAAAAAAAPTPVVVREADGHEYVRVKFNVRNGTQGLVCSVWPEARW